MKYIVWGVFLPESIEMFVPDVWARVHIGQKPWRRCCLLEVSCLFPYSIVFQGSKVKTTVHF